MSQQISQPAPPHAAAAQRRIQDEPAQMARAIALIIQRDGAQRLPLPYDGAKIIAGAMRARQEIAQFARHLRLEDGAEAVARRIVAPMQGRDVAYRAGEPAGVEHQFHRSGSASARAASAMRAGGPGATRRGSVRPVSSTTQWFTSAA